MDHGAHGAVEDEDAFGQQFLDSVPRVQDSTSFEDRRIDWTNYNDQGGSVSAAAGGCRAAVRLARPFSNRRGLLARNRKRRSFNKESGTRNLVTKKTGVRRDDERRRDRQAPRLGGTLLQCLSSSLASGARLEAGSTGPLVHCMEVV
jgi:hypothetical protein